MNKAQSFWYLKYIGLTVSFVALAFALKKAFNHEIWHLAAGSYNVYLPLVVAGGLFNGLNCFSLVFAWRHFLKIATCKTAPMGTTFRVFARTWLGKYLPGNFFHFAARHVVYKRLGVGHVPLIAANGFEIMGQIIVAVSIGLWGLLFCRIQQKGVCLPAFSAAIILGSVGFISAVFILKLLATKEKIEILEKPVLVYCREIWVGYGYYILYFIVYGTVGWLTAIVVSTNYSLVFAKYSFFIFIFAWLAGFLIPGAPAGIGIRETMIIWGLKPYIGESDSILIAFLLRVMAICGDVIFFGLSYCNFNFIKKR